MSMPTHWTEDAPPLCEICGEPGRQVRAGVYTHALPLGGDGVGPKAHGFKVPRSYTEPDWHKAAPAWGVCDECGAELPITHVCR